MTQVNELTNEQLLQELMRLLPDSELTAILAVAAYCSARGIPKPDVSTVSRFAKVCGVDLRRIAPFFGWVLRGNPNRWVDVAEGAHMPPSGIAAAHQTEQLGLSAYVLLGGRTAFLTNTTLVH
ncbi:hypothetical protein HNQ53_002838 [Microbulbifer hydrolyticus]|uniref:Uncharacterized protein n=1 Tax=Microbulbifer hydrolyticus TaxID=48074 RepID=A0AA89PMD8_9GAMM|nr:hypothetical protein [Microbulbifer hydrolyticus]